MSCKNEMMNVLFMRSLRRKFGAYIQSVFDTWEIDTNIALS